MNRLVEVLKRLQAAGLQLKPAKWYLLQKEMKYFGHIMSPMRVTTDPEKVSTIREWPMQKRVKDLQSLLGTFSCYRQYLKDFTIEVKPLHRLTAKVSRWN